MSAAAAAGKPVHAKRKADVDASAATAAAASDTTVAVVAKKAKPSTTLPKSKSPLYNELTAALMKKQEEPAVTGLPIHDLIYHIWQYANDTTGTYSYIKQEGGPALHHPYDVLVVPATSRWKGDSTGLTFLVLNNTSRRICRYSVNDERLTTVILRHNPFSVAACFDPNDSNRVFVSDNQRVYSANEYGHLTTIAGGDVFGMADGIGSVARFQCVAGMVCTGDGSTLYVSDYGNGRVRKIDLSTRAVSTVLKMERDDDTCRSICWDTIDGVKPYSGLYIASENAITRLDIVSGKLTVWDSTFTALHMICTIGGYLVVSIVECNAIYSIDTQTFDIPACIVAGNPYQTGSCDGEVRTEAEFHDPSGFALVADEQALVVADSRNHCLRSVPLPTRLFEKRHRLEVGAVAASPAV